MRVTQPAATAQRNRHRSPAACAHRPHRPPTAHAEQPGSSTQRRTCCSRRHTSPSSYVTPRSPLSLLSTLRFCGRAPRSQTSRRAYTRSNVVMQRAGASPCVPCVSVASPHDLRTSASLPSHCADWAFPQAVAASLHS